MATTAAEQINGALRLIGMLAEAETPSAATAQDALAALNQMVDSWNTERLSVFSTQDQVFTWTPVKLVEPLAQQVTLLATALFCWTMQLILKTLPTAFRLVSRVFINNNMMVLRLKP